MAEIGHHPLYCARSPSTKTHSMAGCEVSTIVEVSLRKKMVGHGEEKKRGRFFTTALPDLLQYDMASDVVES